MKFTRHTEAFIAWFAWSLKYGDLDPAVWATNYLNNRFEHNREQRLWFCWLYGNTYNLPTAWVLLNEFPDFERATLSRIRTFHTKHKARLRYQTDTIKQRPHFPVMFSSYRDFIGNGTQENRLRALYGDNERRTFENLWVAVKDYLAYFGRYRTWFYLQHLKHTAAVPLEPTSLMLNDYSGSRSHRNGLCLALGRKDLVDAKLTERQYASLEAAAAEILMETKHRHPEAVKQADAFAMETALCSFKKIFRKHSGRYLGYYLDRQSEEILRAESDGWTGIDWNVLWQMRDECLDARLAGRQRVNSRRNVYFRSAETIPRIEWLTR